jgi:Uma2 family endonuclease
MATEPRRIRAAEVPHIPVAEPESTGYELVNGELVPVMPATRTPSRVGLEMLVRMHAHVQSIGAGAVYGDVWCHLDLPYDPERLRAPDVAYFGPDKLQAAGDDEIFHVVPDLVVEVFSPTNRRRPGDFQQRVRDYLDAGVPLLWIIYPDARYAMVHRPDGTARMKREDEVLDGEDILPGFRVSLDDLLRHVP